MTSVYLTPASAEEARGKDRFSRRAREPISGSKNFPAGVSMCLLQSIHQSWPRDREPRYTWVPRIRSFMASDPEHVDHVGKGSERGLRFVVGWEGCHLLRSMDLGLFFCT